MAYDLFDKALIKTRHDREVFVKFCGTSGHGMSGSGLAIMKQLDISFKKKLKGSE